MKPITIKSNSLLFTFINRYTTKNSENYFVDEVNGGWIYKHTTCEIAYRIIKSIPLFFLEFFVFYLGCLLCLGDFLGYVAASVMTWSLPEMRFQSFIVVGCMAIAGCLLLVYAIIEGKYKYIEYKRQHAAEIEEKKKSSAFYQIVKAFKDKVCVPIELVD